MTKTDRIDLMQQIADAEPQSGPLSSAPCNTAFEMDVAKTFDKAKNLLIRKHADYGPTNISNSPGGPLNGIRVRLHDKLARINHIYDGETAPLNESLKDSFIDLANYALIGIMVLEGTWPQ